MKKFILLLFITSIAISCTTQKKLTSKNGNSSTLGQSYKTAVVIKEKSETKGVDAEYKWIYKHYPKAKIISQSLVFQDKTPYDIIKIKVKGETKEVYFDISNFFGKF